MVYNSVYKNNDVYKELLDVFKRGVDFNNSISSENIIPVFGDNDSGHVIWLGNNDRNVEYLSQFYNIIKSGSYCGNENYQTFFLANLSGLYPTRKKRINTKINQTLKKFRVFSITYRFFVAVTRVGEQGLEGRASHDHDDSLHTWLSLKEKIFLWIREANRIL